MKNFIPKILSRLKYIFLTPQDQTLGMPLKISISSDKVNTTFFHGENTQIMEGSHISDDSIVGANSYIGFNCIVTKTQIGSYVSIANNVAIGLGEHSLDAISTSSIFYDDPYATLTQLDTNIGPDVWIGQGSVIRRGVSLGLGAAVGALSFVNKDVPPYAVVAGSPAKIIKYRFNEKQREILDASKWWECTAEEAKKKFVELNKELKAHE